MCKVAFNHFFSFSEKQCAGNVLDCFRVSLPPSTSSLLAVQTLETRRHLGEPRLKRIRQNLLLFIATRLGCLPPWSYVTLGNCLPRPHPATLIHIRLPHNPSWLLLWHFGLSLCFTVASLTFPNFVCNSFVVATPLLLLLLL